MKTRIASAVLLSVCLSLSTAHAQRNDEEWCKEKRIRGPYDCMTEEEIIVKKAQERAEAELRQAERRIKEDRQIAAKLVREQRRLEKMSAKTPSPLNCQYHDPEFLDENFFNNFNHYATAFDRHCQSEPMQKTLTFSINEKFDSGKFRRYKDTQTCGFLWTEVRRYLRFAWAIQCPWSERYGHDYPDVRYEQFTLIKPDVSSRPTALTAENDE